MTGKKDKNRTIRFTVRVNEKEAKWLKEAAWREKRSVADYIRSRAISNELPRIPASVEELLKELNYQINKVGININQLVRNYHINGYQTSYEKKKLEEDLQELLALRSLIFDWVRGMADGDHKTLAP